MTPAEMKYCTVLTPGAFAQETTAPCHAFLKHLSSTEGLALSLRDHLMFAKHLRDKQSCLGVMFS